MEPVGGGALEAIDRLLFIADDEQCPAWIVLLQLVCKKLADQTFNDIPLLGVGVLRLIDQNMIQPAIQLV